jgi:choline kinase
VASLRAVVLAAGRGVRMGGAVPKTLLPVAEEEPMLAHILDGLATAGVDDLLVVTGFRPEMVQDFVAGRWKGSVTYVRNARFASWGNFHSLRVGLVQSPGYDVLAVNSDVIVRPDVYRRVVATPGDLVLAVERRWTLDEEDMKVRLDGARVTRIGKWVKRALAQGEFAGISLLRRDAALLYDRAASAAEWAGESDVYYEDVFDRILERCEARAALVEPGEYAEIDEPEDVEAARRVIQTHRAEWGATV